MATYSFKSSGERADSEKYKSRTEPKPIGIKTPLRLSSGKSSLFDMNFTMSDQIRDNFRNLLLTNKGERIGNFGFGSDLQDLATERLAQEDFDTKAMEKIRDAVENFMPFLELSKFESSSTLTDDTSTTVHTMSITYDVPPLRIIDDKIIVDITVIG